MLQTVGWALTACGVTTIVTTSIIFEPWRLWVVRLVGERVGKLFSCPMCFGFWVGVLLALLGSPLAHLPMRWPLWLTAWASGAASSFVCYLAHVVVVRLERA